MFEMAMIIDNGLSTTPSAATATTPPAVTAAYRNYPAAAPPPTTTNPARTDTNQKTNPCTNTLRPVPPPAYPDFQT